VHDLMLQKIDRYQQRTSGCRRAARLVRAVAQRPAGGRIRRPGGWLAAGPDQDCNHCERRGRRTRLFISDPPPGYRSISTRSTCIDTCGCMRRRGMCQRVRTSSNRRRRARIERIFVGKLSVFFSADLCSKKDCSGFFCFCF
jgi:hypothetical protein